MRPILRRAIKIILPIVLIAAGAAGFLFLQQTRPVITPKPATEKVWTVAVTDAEIRSVRPMLDLFGEVVAGRQVELRALVAGEVVNVAPEFREGGRVSAGQLLLAIDEFEYRATLDEKRAILVEAQAKLEEIRARRASEQLALVQDREMLQLTQRELARVQRLRETGNISARAVDSAQMDQSRQRQTLATRQQSLVMEDARLRQQEAAIGRLEVAVRRAERDLGKTRLTAPFSGNLAETSAQLGRRLGINDKVALLTDADDLEVRIQISDGDYGRIIGAGERMVGRDVVVTWQTGNVNSTYNATVKRVGPRFDATSGGVELYAALQLDDKKPLLRPGAFVSVRMADRTFGDVAVVPDTSVHDKKLIYVVIDGRLEERQIDVVGRDGENLLLQGRIASGDKVVTTRFSEIGPGVAVEAR